MRINRQAIHLSEPKRCNEKPSHLWEYLRANKLSMLVWDSYDAILHACRGAWNWLIADPNRVASITQRSRASVWN